MERPPSQSKVMRRNPQMEELTPNKSGDAKVKDGGEIVVCNFGSALHLNDGISSVTKGPDSSVKYF